MKTVNNMAEYDALINSDKPVFLDFYADWCGPCQLLLPIVEELSKEYEGKVEVVKVNVDNNNELAAKFQVRSIPALFFIKNKEVVKKLQGVQTKAILSQSLDELSQN